MEMNKMLSLCKKACNELDDCKNCPNKEKCDDISEIYTLGNLIDENHKFSEGVIIDFYNGFFPEEKEKENKENKKIIPVTPSFKKTVNIIKQSSSKNVVAKGKNLAAIYHSPSPVILHKNKKKIATNEKNRSHSKETYKTPDKKNWVY